MNFAELLSGWRHYEEMSMSQAARKLGLTINTYRALERGDQVNGKYLAVLIAWCLKTPDTQKIIKGFSWDADK
jgi:transcriptional regulator with XRE-family HTH domain